MKAPSSSRFQKATDKQFFFFLMAVSIGKAGTLLRRGTPVSHSCEPAASFVWGETQGRTITQNIPIDPPRPFFLAAVRASSSLLERPGSPLTQGKVQLWVPAGLFLVCDSQEGLLELNIFTD